VCKLYLLFISVDTAQEKEKTEEKKVLLPSGVSKSAAHAVSSKGSPSTFPNNIFILVSRESYLPLDGARERSSACFNIFRTWTATTSQTIAARVNGRAGFFPEWWLADVGVSPMALADLVRTRQNIFVCE
jgi:hypothetical protein